MTVQIVVEDGTVTVDGQPIDANGDGLERAAVRHIASTLDDGATVNAVATVDGEATLLTVHADGSTSGAGPVPEPSGTPSTTVSSPTPDAAPLHVVANREEVDVPIHAAPGLPRHARKSFITEEPALQPARQGFRGMVNRMGLRLDPGAKEVDWRRDVQAVSQHWPGARTIAIANQKGGSGKTPATVLLSAILARYGGAGVLAWDNNETEGNIRMRTQAANHDSTVLNMLPIVDHLLSPNASAAELAHYTHHQPADKYDVLHSDDSLLGEHEISADDVHAIHRVASRYYRMIVMDSGNNRKAANWLAMIEHANALVIPCTDVKDSPEIGARIIDALHARGDERSASLASNAVAVVSQKTEGKQARAHIEEISENFSSFVREVVTIPYDPALVGGVIHFDSLRPATQRAWLRAAAAVARGL